LTDIAKQSTDEPRFVIQNWLKNSNTITYLWEWELLHNPKLNRVQMHTVLETTATNRFVMSPKKWIELTGAIGLVSQPGRNGGTLAHKDIALNFCYWLSPKFQIYLIKEFQRLKEEEFSKKKPRMAY
jgi:KilA-N domain